MTYENVYNLGEAMFFLLFFGIIFSFIQMVHCNSNSVTRCVYWIILSHSWVKTWIWHINNDFENDSDQLCAIPY